MGEQKARAAVRPRLYLVLVTFRRSNEFRLTLESVAVQTMPPHMVVIVDNSEQEPLDAGVWEPLHAAHVAHDYIVSASNVGPAGGRALGADRVMVSARDDDWVLFLDEDDPLPHALMLAKILHLATAMQEENPATAGVGLRGAYFRPLRARTIAARGTGVLSVDHLHGNFFPAYSIGAIRDVGCFDPSLFFGFEELELGLRFRDAGYSLYASSELLQELPASRRVAGIARHPSLRLSGEGWRRYYSLRNLCYLLLRRGHRITAARVALTRGILKPLLSLPFHQKKAREQLRLSISAIRDAFAGKMYKVIEPEYFE